MDLRAAGRVFLVVVLISLFFASGIHYAAVEEEHSPYPLNEDLKTNPGQYVDQHVFVLGTVESIDEVEENATIAIDSDKGPFYAEITGFHPQSTVEPGGIVQVYGTFQEPRVIEAENVRVVNPAGSSNLYKYSVSAVAAVMILLLFFRYWRVNIRTLSFEVR